MTIKLSSKGGGGTPKLATELTYPSSIGTAHYKQIVGINATAGLTTALSLSGRFFIELIQFINLTAETITVKLTVDGVTIWNDTFTSGTSLPLIGNTSVGSNAVKCDSTFLLEIQTATDTSIDLRYIARPIL